MSIDILVTCKKLIYFFIHILVLNIITDVVTKSNSQIVYKKAKPKRKFKFPCGISDKNVKKNQKSIYYNNCGIWVHKFCEGLTDGEFQKLFEEDESIPWSCLVCEVKSNAEIFPFCLLSELELLDLYGIDLPSHVETLPYMKLVQNSLTCQFLMTLTLMKMPSMLLIQNTIV